MVCLLACAPFLACPSWKHAHPLQTGSPRTQPQDLQLSDFQRAEHAYLSAYLSYQPGLLERAVELAQAAGCKVALDLGSFEVVRAFLPQLRSLVESGAVDCCFANEDESVEVLGGTAAAGATPQAGLDYLAAHCGMAVVTLGEKGCLVRQRGSDEVVVEPACSGVKAVDSTGAGDLFAAGFLYGSIRGYPARRCAQVSGRVGGTLVVS